VAKCRIDSFRFRGTGSMCHMFLLNLEFSNACRFRVFQCHFSTVSRFPFPRFRSLAPVLTQTNRVLEVSRIFTKHWKCCDKFFVLTMSLYAFISLLYKQLLVHAVEIFQCTIRFINQISKEVPYQTFSISFHFHKMFHENTFALTLPCFIWVSTAIAKHAHFVFSVFCQCSSFIVNGITEI